MTTSRPRPPAFLYSTLRVTFGMSDSSPLMLAYRTQRQTNATVDALHKLSCTLTAELDRRVETVETKEDITLAVSELTCSHIEKDFHADPSFWPIYTSRIVPALASTPSVNSTTSTETLLAALSQTYPILADTADYSVEHGEYFDSIVRVETGIPHDAVGWTAISTGGAKGYRIDHHQGRALAVEYRTYRG